MSTATRKPAAARPRRPQAPSLPPLETMNASHREIAQVLGQMEQLARALGTPGEESKAVRLAAHACQFFNGPARAHHEVEETQVFPSLLASHDPLLREQVQQMQRDHHWIEEDWLEIEPHLQAAAQGRGSHHLEFLGPALAEFTALYREHLAVEDALLRG